MTKPAPTVGEVDWISLWNQLVRQREDARRPVPLPDTDDRWSARAEGYDARMQARWAAQDSSRDFLVSLLKSLPEPTLLDIGAGSGKWTVPLAPYCRHVTAVEPSPAMHTRLTQHLRARSLAHVSVVPETWPCPGVPAHDVTLCSHAMYGFNDFAGFVRGVQAVTRHTCVWLMRAPPLDGIMAEAARRVQGHPYDSVNFHIAINALLQMGLFPNVRMEDPRTWDPWEHGSVAEALTEVKRRLRLYDDTTHDAFLNDLLERRLIRRGGRYVWPCGTHAALLYWRVNPEDSHA